MTFLQGLWWLCKFLGITCVLLVMVCVMAGLIKTLAEIIRNDKKDEDKNDESTRDR